MMAGMITLVLTGLLRGVRTQRSLVFENLALRHQLAVLQRAAPRPRLRRSDRLFCDRDGVYGVEFSSRVKGMGICEVKTAPRSPWQNPYVERLIGTLRRECLDHVVVLNETIYVACCANTSSTITAPEHTSRWIRTRRSQDWSSASSTAGSSRRPWSAAFIIAIPARRRKILRACGGCRQAKAAGPAGHGGSPRSSYAVRLTLHTEHAGPRGMFLGAMVQPLDERPQLFHTPGWVKQKGHPRAAPAREA